MYVGRAHCIRNHPGYRCHLVLLNSGIAAACIAIYASNEFGVKALFMSTFFHGHFNDMLAGVVLLAYANLLATLAHQPRLEFRSPVKALVLVLVAGLYWEEIAPLYTTSTADPWDLLAYVGGGLVYVLISVLFERRWTM